MSIETKRRYSSAWLKIINLPDYKRAELMCAVFGYHEVRGNVEFVTALESIFNKMEGNQNGTKDTL